VGQKVRDIHNLGQIMLGVEEEVVTACPPERRGLNLHNHKHHHLWLQALDSPVGDIREVLLEITPDLEVVEEEQGKQEITVGHQLQHQLEELVEMDIKFPHLLLIHLFQFYRILFLVLRIIVPHLDTLVVGEEELTTITMQELEGDLELLVV
jgi:hypothetical protein